MDGIGAQIYRLCRKMEVLKFNSCLQYMINVSSIHNTLLISICLLLTIQCFSYSQLASCGNCCSSQVTPLMATCSAPKQVLVTITHCCIFRFSEHELIMHVSLIILLIQIIANIPRRSPLVWLQVQHCLAHICILKEKVSHFSNRQSWLMVADQT